MDNINLTQFDETNLLERLKSFFPDGKLEKLAKASGFVRRSTSQLTGTNFLLLNISGSVASQNMSLRESCIWLEDEYGVKMRKQSLDERYNTDSVSFMKMCLGQVLDCLNGFSESSAIRFPFSCVQLTDATTFKIPSSLSTFYEGFGGNGGDAMLKVHLNYNLLNNSVCDISFRSGKENDKKYFLGKDEEIVKGGLYIRDLGYFLIDFFREVAANEAYFLSRGLSNASYYEASNGSYTKLNLESLLPPAGTSFEKEVYMGDGKKGWVKSRMILQAVPEEVRLKRLAKLEKKENGSKNWKASDFRKKMCGYNFFITNAPKALLPLEHIWYAYRLRWQIELVFKIWKSVFNIDKVGQMSIFRFECHLYATLISILTSLNIQGEIGGFLWNEYEYEISPEKAVGILKKKFHN